MLLDTHAWFWWATGSSRLSSKASRAIREAGTIYVSVLSCWEMAMLAAKKRVILDRDVEVWVNHALQLPKVQLAPLTPRSAIRSTRLGTEIHGDPVDRFLVSTAMEEGWPIVSKDERIQAFSGVRVIW